MKNIDDFSLELLIIRQQKRMVTTPSFFNLFTLNLKNGNRFASSTPSVSKKL